MEGRGEQYERKRDWARPEGGVMKRRQGRRKNVRDEMTDRTKKERKVGWETKRVMDRKRLGRGLTQRDRDNIRGDEMEI